MDSDSIHVVEVPGTIFMVDVGHNLKSTAIHKGRSDVILIPTPTSSPRDPLNWPKRKKYYTLFVCTVFACAMGFNEQVLGAGWGDISVEKGVSLNNMNGGSGLNFLVLGFSNLFWIPAAQKLGRKFVYVTCATLSIPFGYWIAAFQNTGQWYAANAFIGIVGSVYQAIIQLTVFDTFYTHEHGVMIAIYLLGQQMGSLFGLMFGGFITDALSWQWCQYIFMIFIGSVDLLVIFTMDDTLFYRNAFPTISAPVSQLQDVESTSHDSNKLSGSPEKVHTPVNTTSHTGGSYTMPEAYSYPRTYLEILAPIHRFKEDKTTFIQYFCRPLILVLFPNVVLSGVLYAFAATSGIVSFNTIAEIMQSAPYNWSTGATGLIFIGALVGAAIGVLTGKFGDWLVIKLTIRNKGYKEPEMRLWTLGFSMIYASVGYFSYGWGAQTGAPWITISIGVVGLIAQLVTTSSVVTTYAMECFDEASGEVVVVLACCSALINFAISFTVQDMIDATSMGWTFTFYGLLVLASILSATTMIYWGKSWRMMSAPRYYKFLEARV